MTVQEHELQIELHDNHMLSATLSLPMEAQGLVLFAHGSGSSRKSPRNRYVAGVLQQAGFATLLFDLLTTDEERFDNATGQLRFDISLLTDRLIAVTRWAEKHEALSNFHVGYFGASTGAAAALSAAAALPERVFAVVSRGGRPDLAVAMLPKVRAPTLLIVGGLDQEVLALNERARDRLHCCSLEIVAGATHLFEEPGALEEVALLASQWFQEYLPAAGRVVDLRSRTNDHP